MKNGFIKLLLSSLLVGCNCSTVRVNVDDVSLNDASSDAELDSSLEDASDSEVTSVSDSETTKVTKFNPVIQNVDGSTVYVFDDFRFKLTDGFDVAHDVRVEGDYFYLVAVKNNVKFGLMYSPLDRSLSVVDFNSEVLTHLKQKESDKVLKIKSHYNEVLNGTDVLVVETTSGSLTYTFVHAINNEGTYIFSCGGNSLSDKDVLECNTALNSVVFER